MITIDNPQLYEAALASLAQFRPRGYKGRLVQIFLAARYLGSEIPPVGRGEASETGALQRKLDDFYRRRTRRDEVGSIAIIFSNNHLVPTGQIGPDLGVAANIWRNNLGLQKALICYASEVELTQPAFLAQPRVNCPHLLPEIAGQLRNARCGLHNAASYRKEDGPKGLRRDPIDNGLSIVNPRLLAHWSHILAPEGHRIPVLPLIVALYHDAQIAAGRTQLDAVDFRRDFGFTSDEFAIYFDSSPASDINDALVRAFPQLQLSWTEQLDPVPAAGLPPQVAAPAQRGRGRRELLDPDGLPELAARTQPPAGNHWWSAEQAVGTYLRDSGWDVVDRTRQHVGFDLEINRRQGGPHFYIEVKSSVGPCNPTLTRSEFEAARRYGNRYVLAIVENFDPGTYVSILWVSDPASLPVRPRTVEQFAIPRSVWLPSASISVDR